MRPVFADPKTDIIFKKIFGEQAHKGLLIELLNALQEYEREKMAEQDYRGGISLAESRAERQAQLQTLDMAALQALRQHIKSQRGWPVEHEKV